MDRQIGLLDQPLRTSTPKGQTISESNAGDGCSRTIQQQQLPIDNPPLTTTLCCAQMRCENKLLRRALRKEREERMFIGRAYQELLHTYEMLIDLKSVIDIPSPSISSTSADDQIPQSGRLRQMQQYFQYPPAAAASSSSSLALPLPRTQIAGGYVASPRPFPTNLLIDFSKEDDVQQQQKKQKQPEPVHAAPIINGNQQQQEKQQPLHAAPIVNDNQQQQREPSELGRNYLKKNSSQLRYAVIQQKNQEKIHAAVLGRGGSFIMRQAPPPPPPEKQLPTAQIPGGSLAMRQAPPPPAPKPVPTKPIPTIHQSRAALATGQQQQQPPPQRPRGPFRELNTNTGGLNQQNQQPNTKKPQSPPKPVTANHKEQRILPQPPAPTAPQKTKPYKGMPKKVVTGQKEQQRHPVTSQKEQQRHPQQQMAATNMRQRQNDEMVDENDEEEDTMVEEDTIVETAMKRRMDQQKKQKPNWYFVSFDENNDQQQQQGDKYQANFAAQRRIRELVSNSRARLEAIREASRRRATVAANRRAIIGDLINGKRELDDEAMCALHTDSSKISAFPEFMRQMRRASKRAFHKSPVRQQQEMDRERLIERATNRILAQSSAAITRTKAYLTHRN